MGLPDQPDLLLTDRQRDRAELRNVIAMAVPVVITTGSRAFMDIADYMMITRLQVSDQKGHVFVDFRMLSQIGNDVCSENADVGLSSAVNGNTGVDVVGGIVLFDFLLPVFCVAAEKINFT